MNKEEKYERIPDEHDYDHEEVTASKLIFCFALLGLIIYGRFFGFAQDDLMGNEYDSLDSDPTYKDGKHIVIVDPKKRNLQELIDEAELGVVIIDPVEENLCEPIPDEEPLALEGIESDLLGLDDEEAFKLYLSYVSLFPSDYLTKEVNGDNLTLNIRENVNSNIQYNELGIKMDALLGLLNDCGKNINCKLYIDRSISSNVDYRSLIDNYTNINCQVYLTDSFDAFYDLSTILKNIEGVGVANLTIKDAESLSNALKQILAQLSENGELNIYGHAERALEHIPDNKAFKNVSLTIDATNQTKISEIKSARLSLSFNNITKTSVDISPEVEFLELSASADSVITLNVDDREKELFIRTDCPNTILTTASDKITIQYYLSSLDEFYMLYQKGMLGLPNVKVSLFLDDIFYTVEIEDGNYNLYRYDEANLGLVKVGTIVIKDNQIDVVWEEKTAKLTRSNE